MRVLQGENEIFTRFYLGRQYEQDVQTNIERLYLGGDAYSAPAVLIREGVGGLWNIHYLCRDYLGSITHIVRADGTVNVRQELSYDAWGRLRNPNSQTLFAPGNEPNLLLGRGFTGHEHLPWFGLINCNARLYDPAVGRFLMPDPYVVNPLFSQDYNRYTYCRNNPLKYIDPDGELAFLIPIGIGALIFGAGNLAAQAIAGNVNSWGDGFRAFGQGALVGAALGAAWYFAPTIVTPFFNWSINTQKLMTAYGIAQIGIGAVGMIGGAINDGWDGMGRAGKLFLGNFNLDENRGRFFGGVLQGVSRHTWEFIQTLGGHGFGQVRNMAGNVDHVKFWGGNTFFITENVSDFGRWRGASWSNFNAIKLGGEFDRNYPGGWMLSEGGLFMHEFGHTFDSRRFGLFYLLAIGIPSASGARWTETLANRNAFNYMRRRGILDSWDRFNREFPLR